MPDQFSKIKNSFFVLAGTISLGFGVIGIFLPLVPTTPLLLLSAACYYKGSKRMHHWMLTNKWFGPYLKNYQDGRGISIRTKLLTIVLLWITLSYTSLIVINYLPIQVILFVIAITVTFHILTRPTFKD